ncbi:hypothetical protein [Galbibacter pacificus]|uniref:Calcium-binding protein n=1 Tax=Galbibacter pacificus TaxID=2996052 RepID=A0ABT6FV25_9FLAO|nr:hypothetical protein [Galbibacter pacificus]MDG3583404.1 hypothetical protein [Galbibacter pacificus]MDG3587119.1 hypothetical protein [Galbibacter pacificus]
MRKIFFFAVLILCASCDDGDIVIDPLTFDNTDIQPACGDITLFKISDNKEEALIMKISPSSSTPPVFTTVDTLNFTINNEANKVVYRIFDDEVSNSYFCQDVPPTTPLATEEWYAPSGTIQIITTVEDDDQDGVPTSQEGVVYNDDGTVNQEESRDTDGDGFPDYIDNDDDDDNILTSEEIDFDDQKQLILIDTDGDDTPNYLDADDDNDNIPTIDEDLNGDGNPANDTTDIDGETIPNYLTTVAAVETTNHFGRKANKYQRIYTSVIKIINGFQLVNEGDEEIKYDVDEYYFGTIETPISQTEKL